MRNRLFRRLLMVAGGVLILGSGPAAAQDRLCDPGDEDCRAILITYIRNETIGIDVAFWFMEDARYTAELIVLSHTTFVSTSPGALKNDTRVLARTN